MIIQDRTNSVALTCKQGQTSKTKHKILISQIALTDTIIDTSVTIVDIGREPASNRNATNDKNVTK